MFCVLKAGDMEEDAIFFKNRLDELNHKYINLEETVVLSLSAYKVGQIILVGKIH